MHNGTRPSHSHRTTQLIQRVQKTALTMINSDEFDESSESDDSDEPLTFRSQPNSETNRPHPDKLENLRRIEIG